MRSGQRRRGGYVLVLVAMMLFGLFAMAALVIDLGFARLAQRQMQTATDAAALEGARNGDMAARHLVEMIFDDDLDPTDDPRHFGAGPIVTLTDSPNVSNSALAASQDLSIPANRSYKPVMEVGTGVGVGEFQVILQRGATIEASLTPNLYDEGPPIEFLFGRGSMLRRDRIQNGISVGSISRTRNEPVIFIGEPVPQFSHPAVLPYAVSINDWVDADTVDPNGVALTDADEFFPATSKLIGVQVVTTSSVTASGEGYVAIFSGVANSRIIGFGLGTIVDLAGGQQQIAPSTDQVATVNVCATICVPLPDMSDDVGVVFSERSSYKDVLLVAPVLVRN